MGQDKYTDFWKNFVYKIRDAFAQGQNTVQLDVKQLAEVGDRSSYTGSVTVRFGQVVSFTDAAPYRDLVQVLKTSSVIKPFLNNEFTIRVDNTLTLTATYNQLHIADLITTYKKLVAANNDQEVYKWNTLGKKHFDLEAFDFYKMIKSIDFHNLVYHNAKVVLWELSENYPEDMRAAFKALFDENLNLYQRVVYFRNTVDTLYRKRQPTLPSHQDERSIATYLTYYNPDKYSLYKDAFYTKYCKLLGLKPANVNEKYVHYLSLVNDLIQKHIKTDIELQQLEKKFTPPDAFPDSNYTLLAQDILYQTLEGTWDEDPPLSAPSQQESTKLLEDALPKITAPLNQILYGPPGTGKTYHTINRALQIVAPEYYEQFKDDRGKLTAKFNELLIKDWKNPKGQIAFVTFHQSMTYEDFIEGIKPDLEGGDGIEYILQDGIFKNICKEAGKKVESSDNFEEVYESLLKEIEANGDQLTLKTIAQNKEFIIYENSKSNLRFHANKENAYDGVIKKDVIAAYLRTGEILDWAPYTKAVAEYIRTKHNYASNQKTSINRYVLIIDEINRGNVSQIFGELITLIEDDKRTEGKEALKVFLPYSKSTFSVPSNLYIVGTMNTADRSVEALDTALRRRFAFEEMMPDDSLLSPLKLLSRFLSREDIANISYDDWDKEPHKSVFNSFYELIGLSEEKDKALVSKQFALIHYQREDKPILTRNDLTGLDLQKLLATINERLSVLLSNDNTIGHAWLMNIWSLRDLQERFADKIFPLLKEYFYNNYAKIGLVLGDRFVRQQRVKKNIFAKFNDEQDLINDFDGKIMYELVNPFSLTIKDFESIYN